MTANISDIEIAPLKPDDIGNAQRLSANLNWPHRLEDWQFLEALGDGFGAYRGSELVGTSYCWPHSETLATLGMVIVSPSLQGRGIGAALTRRAMEAAGSRTILLNATDAGLPLYARLGFREFGQVRQHQGVIDSAPEITGVEDVAVRAFREGDIELVETLDSAATGFVRKALLAALANVAEGAVLEDGERATGYALIRPFGRGRSIGPVVAPTVTGARALIAALLQDEIGRFVRIDTPVAELSPWLDAIGMKFASPVTAMVHGDLPRGSGGRLFGLVSQALG